MKKGFTLLEILVAMGVLAILGTVIAQVFFTTTRTNTKVEISKDVKQNGDFAMEVMSRIVRNAASVTTVCSDTGTATDTITVDNLDGGITTFECVLDGDITRIASTSAGRTDYLTSSSLTLGGTDCTGATLQFVCMSPVDGPTTVAIAFTLAQKGTPVDQFEKASASFQTTVAIRNISIP